MPSTMGPYDQIILFGDSLTEQSANPELDFIFMAALQNCTSITASIPRACAIRILSSLSTS